MHYTINQLKIILHEMVTRLNVTSLTNVLSVQHILFTQSQILSPLLWSPEPKPQMNSSCRSRVMSRLHCIQEFVK